MPEQGAGDWFRCWQSENGEKLSDSQISRLTGLTMGLEYSTEESIGKWKIWAADATAFWGKSFNTKSEFLRHVLEENNLPNQGTNTRRKARKRQTRKEDKKTKRAPLQRRVSIVILNGMIEEEIERLKNLSQTEKSPGPPDTTKYLTSAVKNLVHEAFQDLQKQKDLRGRCTTLQRYGAKWSLLPKECILAPLKYTSKNFERIGLLEVDIEALNAYVRHKVSPEHREQAQKAYSSIYDVYRKRKGPQLGNCRPESIAQQQLPQTGRRWVQDNQSTTPHCGRFPVDMATPKVPSSVRIDSSLESGVEDKGVPPGLINSRDRSGPSETDFNNKSLTHITPVVEDINSWAELDENAKAASFPQQLLQQNPSQDSSHTLLRLRPPESIDALPPFYGAEPSTKDMGYMPNPILPSYTDPGRDFNQRQPYATGNMECMSSSDLGAAASYYIESGTDLDSWANFDERQPYTMDNIDYMPSSDLGAATSHYIGSGTDLDSWANFDERQPYTMDNIDYMPSSDLGAATSHYIESGTDLDSWADFDQRQPYTMENNMDYMPSSELGAATYPYTEPGTDMDSWADFEHTQPHTMENPSSIANSILDTASDPHAEHGRDLNSHTNFGRTDTFRNSILAS